MNVNNLIEAARDDLTILFEELTSPRGVRAVAAWQALCEPDVSYALDDEEAPYEFRHAVGTDIGWEAAQEGLDPNGDILRYVVYMRLHAALGADWPENALRRYLQVEKGWTALSPRRWLRSCGASQSNAMRRCASRCRVRKNSRTRR